MSVLGRLTIARRYHALGFNLVTLVGNKKPGDKWRHGSLDLTAERQSLADLEALNWRQARGLAAVLGPVSGGLIQIDFDKQDRRAVDAFLRAVGYEPDYPWQVITPGGGWHVWFLCSDIVLHLNGTGRLDRPCIYGGQWDGSQPDRKLPHTELRYDRAVGTLPPTRSANGQYRFMGDIPDGPPALVTYQQLRSAYEAVTLPEPESPPLAPRHVEPSELPSDIRALWEYYQTEIVEAAAVREWKIAPPNSKGWSRKNFSAPPSHRDDRSNPDCGWNYEKHGFKDFVTGEFYTTHYVAELLGLPTWEQYKEDHLLDVAAERSQGLLGRSSLHPNAAGIAGANQHLDNEIPAWFERGVPRDLASYLLGLNRIKALIPAEERFESYRPAVVLLILLEALIRAGHLAQLQKGVTRSDLLHLFEQIGADPSRDTVQTGLAQLVQLRALEACHFCNQISDLESASDLVSKVAAPDSDEPRYQLGRLDEFLETARQIVLRLKRAELFYEAGAPDDVQLEWADFTPEEAALLDEHWAGFYDQCAASRRWARYELRRVLLDLDVEKLLHGEYAPLPALPLAELRNGKAVVDLLYDAELEATRQTGKPREAWRSERLLGVSPATMSRMRKKRGVITLPQVIPMPSERVTPRMHEKGLVIAEQGDGTTLVKGPRWEKIPLLDGEEPKPCHITTGDIPIYEALIEQQRRRGLASQRKRRQKQEQAAHEAAAASNLIEYAQQLEPSQPGGEDQARPDLDPWLAHASALGVERPDPEPPKEAEAPAKLPAIAPTVRTPQRLLAPMCYSAAYVNWQLDIRPGGNDIPYQGISQDGEIMEYSPADRWRLMLDQVEREQQEAQQPDSAPEQLEELAESYADQADEQPDAAPAAPLISQVVEAQYRLVVCPGCEQQRQEWLSTGHCIHCAPKPRPPAPPALSDEQRRARAALDGVTT
jgi:hypothetical protein